MTTSSIPGTVLDPVEFGIAHWGAEEQKFLGIESPGVFPDR